MSWTITIYIDFDVIAHILSVCAKSSFFPDYSILPRSLHSFHQITLADSVGAARPFLSGDFLPERALCYTASAPYFSLFDSSFSTLEGADSLYSCRTYDISFLAFFLYNVTFFHFIFLGFIFTVVIVGVISLLLNRNLRVRRQRVFDQNAISLLNSLRID